MFLAGTAETVGADLVLGARRSGRLSETARLVESLGRRALSVPTDVAEPASCDALVRAALDHLGRIDILVNAVAPGFFPSEMTEQYAPGYVAEQLKRIPSGRMGDLRELAATVVFLASDAAGYIVGQTLVVDGGRTIA
jgi:NAD(P)-dependent dehydrogenase (short-subunit alcohol dehydrogenase family)